ncbi:MAG: DUF4330 family protein [Acidobacteriota bacterium]|nr:DUF4330 family protein [Acidobacteriota bacterium]
MTIVDNRGRLFGRINLVDATVLIFLIVLIPVAYGTFLLFRPASPRIDSVSLTDLSKEEFRVANGALLSAKLKVKGTGFNPLLRASIGNTPAMGFVFENPNSADVLVGEVPMGTHDLVLFDGVQEVARAVGAVTIHDTVGTIVRTVGWFTGLDSAAVKTLQVGFASPKETRAAFEIVAIGPPQPARSRIQFGNSAVDMPLEGYLEREAVLTVRCDSPGPACSVGGVRLRELSPIAVTLAGGLGYEIQEILPMSDPARGRVHVRFTGPHVAMMKAGDRDAFLDPRAARLTEVAARDGTAVTATVEMGLDNSREGWRYRGQVLRPGALFHITTDRYEANGLVVSIDVAEASAQSGKTP